MIADELTGEPLKDQPYRITLASQQVIEGTSNGKGETSLATIAASVNEDAPCGSIIHSMADELLAGSIHGV